MKLINMYINDNGKIIPAIKEEEFEEDIDTSAVIRLGGVKKMKLQSPSGMAVSSISRKRTK